MAGETFDADILRRAMGLFHDALVEHRDELNSLNVYPVPDGDTGTNMLLTQQAVRDELSGLGDADMGRLTQAIGRASLMGARGNSGVILAQAMRGLVSVVGDESVDARGLAAALERASAEAYRAVAKPVRGTVLDVLAGAAASALGAADEGGDVRDVSRRALEGARTALARTRELLPELRTAGVVDAGGKGAVLLFDALRAAVAGTDLTERVGPLGPVGTGEEGPEEPTFRYEVQLLIDAEESVMARLRERLSALGDSLVIVGGEGTYKVHLHTNRPKEAVALAGEAGRTSTVATADLADDVAACLAGQARAMRAIENQTSALLAVADGEGLERILESLGATVVAGGPGNNPSVGEILRALDAAPADAVLLLPDHRNVVPAARRAAEASSKEVRVIDATSIPQGIAGATAFNPDASLEENAYAMTEAARACEWGEVARAVRDAETPGGSVRTGEHLGLVGGDVVLVSATAEDATAQVVDRLRNARHEILTVFVGADVPDDDATVLEKRLRDSYADLEVEFHQGGQPGYPYLIGLE